MFNWLRAAVSTAARRYACFFIFWLILLTHPNIELSNLFLLPSWQLGKTCFVCGEKNEPLQRCSHSSCVKLYHTECVGELRMTKSRRLRFVCPQHACDTCDRRGTPQDTISGMIFQTFSLEQVSIGLWEEIRNNFILMPSRQLENFEFIGFCRLPASSVIL